jgi:Mg2+ and Co2+ transporter CorA
MSETNKQIVAVLDSMATLLESMNDRLDKAEDKIEDGYSTTFRDSDKVNDLFGKLSELRQAVDKGDT